MTGNTERSVAGRACSPSEPAAEPVRGESFRGQCLQLGPPTRRALPLWQAYAGFGTDGVSWRWPLVIRWSTEKRPEP